MKKLAFTTTWLSIFLTTVLCSQILAYQEIEVKNGGTIQGKAFLTGKNPPPRIFHLVLYPNLDMCAEVEQDEETKTDDELNRVMYDFLEDSDRGLRDVVVTLEKVEAGKPFNDKPIMIRSENCKFYPTVNIIRQGAVFHVDNVDAVMHNSQVYQAERGKIILNIPIPAEQVSDGHVTFEKNYKLMQMICGMHEFMQTWGYRVENPYYFKTGVDGSFKIDNIPPGKYKVNAWHFLMKLESQMVTVPENGTVDIKFEFDGGQIERSLYETIKSGRIKKDARVPGSIH
ncbi:MAG: carboxypeptidase regulatory-like domain-containing protein [Candidatus Nitronauta litoralis]|uniref:Carboxypeptidase regulatory-like domain-containing protein n=1 Tax=Candidatus Nitronauta litoralis TaxID=2705533 RepID=A0A7T0BYY9_9BACT|nr:MAG: carboxypeptidase regulatory-like domain-containing protein [Candidatus Nitronauta litoralis]